MPNKPPHVNWLVNTGQTKLSANGKTIEIWELQHQNDPAILAEWARHFRNQYCLDSEIDILRRGTGLSRTEYLNKYKFPDASIVPGPSIRSGDFAEIVAADFLEFIENYWVPRERYKEKAIRNESVKGTDTIGFKFHIDENNQSPQDTLAVFESKAQYSVKSPKPRLQNAVDASAKDITRKAESLNAIKQRFLTQKDLPSVAKVERFQNEVDRPYQQVFGSVAHFDNSVFDDQLLSTTDSSKHPYSNQVRLIVIKGDSMMQLVHALYQRAANEA